MNTIINDWGIGLIENQYVIWFHWITMDYVYIDYRNINDYIVPHNWLIC